MEGLALIQGGDSGGGVVGWAGNCIVSFNSAEAVDQRKAEGAGSGGEGKGAAGRGQAWEKVGDGSDHKAEDGEVGGLGVAREQAFEGAADEKGRGDQAEGKGEEREKVEVGKAAGEVFVEAEHQEHLRGADAGEHERQSDDEAADDLDDESAWPACAKAEASVGQTRDEEDEGESEAGKKGVSPVEAGAAGFAPEKGKAATHRADEEPARRHVEVDEQNVAHQFGDGDDAEAGAGAEGEEKGEA